MGSGSLAGRVGRRWLVFGLAILMASLMASPVFERASEVATQGIAPAPSTLAAPAASWTVQSSGAGKDYAQAVAVDATGVYMAGFTTGDVIWADHTEGVCDEHDVVLGAHDAFLRKYDANGNVSRTIRFGTPQDDYAYALDVDATGVYVAGQTEGIFAGQTGAGFRDAFVQKYDLNLHGPLWTQQFGSASSDMASAIAVDATGVYVAGSTRGTLPDQTSAGDYDAFVRKYDLYGGHVWTRQFGSTVGGNPSWDVASAIAVDASTVYVAGTVDGALPGQARIGSWDAFVRTYAVNGSLGWTSQFGTPTAEIAYGLAVDATGVYVAGQTMGAFPGYANLGEGDAFIRKYRLTGTDLWTSQSGTPSGDEARALALDATGVYVAGYTYGVFPGQSGAGGIDAFVQKHDLTGAQVWTSQFGTPSDDEAYALAVDATGVYAAGTTKGAFPGQTSGGDVDAMLRKYDAGGNVLWTRQFGSFVVDEAFAVAVDATGIYVAGITVSVLPGQTSAGDCDAFLQKYDAGGNLLWSRQFGTALYDTAKALAVDATGVYVAGSTAGTLPGQTSAGGSDAVLRKYDANGNVLWTIQFGTPWRDEATALATDATGIYVAGQTWSVFTIPGEDVEPDAFVWKFDSGGQGLWMDQFGSREWDEATALAADGTSVYAAGFTGGVLPDQTSMGKYDGFVRKYNANGAVAWTVQFGTPVDEYARATAVDATGVYVAGEVGPVCCPSGEVIPSDAFVRKFDSGGTELWMDQFGTSGWDEALAVAVRGTAVYVAGVFTEHTDMYGRDAFVRKYTRSGACVWTDQFGTDEDDSARALAVDATGLYVAGATGGSFPGWTNQGGRNTFLRKYPPPWLFPWTRQFGTLHEDAAHALATHLEHIHVAGNTAGALPGQASAGGQDAFLREYDPDGNELWTRQFGTASDDWAYALAVDATGEYVAGYTLGALPGETNAGSRDAFLRKYDPGGGVLWTTEFGTPGLDAVWAIAVDATGVYVAGNTAGSLPGQTSAGGSDAFVRKYDPGGSIVWTRQFGTSNSDVANAVAVDATGVYVAGATAGVFAGQASAGGQDAFVRRYDANGTVAWTAQLGTSAADTAKALAVDGPAVYVAGYTDGAFQGLTSAGGTDAFVRRYGANGTAAWTVQFGSPVGDYAQATAVDAAGVYVAGHTEGAFPGQTNAGSLDGFVRQYDAGGNEVWTVQFGTSAYDYAFALATCGTRVCVAGSTGGTFPGQMPAGAYDAFVGQPWVPPAAPGLLRVTTNPAVAAKIYVDGVPRDEWGLAWMKIEPGLHTIAFGDVYGFGTPASQTVEVTAGATATVQGDYVAEGSLRVITNPALPATIDIIGSDCCDFHPSDDWGVWRSAAPGTYVVRFGAVAGWDPPADKTVTVTAGQLTTVVGDYVANAAAPGPDPSTYGMLRVTTNPAVPAQILVDGIPRDEWGLAWLKLPPGTYTVSFRGVYGFTTPAPTTVTVTAGATTTYNAQFIAHGSLRVITNPAVPATVFVDGVARDDWGMWQSMPPGTYTVGFGEVPGYVTPPSQTVTVTAGAYTPVIGTYVVGGLAAQSVDSAVSTTAASTLAAVKPHARSTKDGT